MSCTFRSSRCVRLLGMVAIILLLSTRIFLKNDYYPMLSDIMNNLIVDYDHQHTNNNTATIIRNDSSAILTTKPPSPLRIINNSSGTNTTTNSNITCLYGRKLYGDNCNRIVQVANMFLSGEQYHHRVGLHGAAWNNWYNEWFDDESNVFSNRIVNMDKRSRCTDLVFSNNDALLRISLHAVNRPLMQFFPKRSIREQAEREVEKLKQQHYNNTTTTTKKLVSVHRRNMDGSCHKRAQMPGLNWCQSENESIVVQNVCNLTYHNITEQLRIQYNDDDDTVLIVLFTDGQVPELDNTFPVRVNDTIDFKVQLWMMVLSDVHFGIPMSSVDHVVNHWRQGREMHPKECYHITDHQEEEEATSEGS